MPVDHEFLVHPVDAEVRASAGRIIDILQQLVLVRPELIIPFEELLIGMLPGLRMRVVTQVVTQVWAQQDALASPGRTPLPAMPLSKLPGMPAVLEPPARERTIRQRTMRPAGKPRRR